MTDHYQIRPIPVGRRIVVDAGRLGARRHMIHGLVEFDVTTTRQFIREQKATTGESFSFTAFIVASLARAIQDYPAVQAYCNWRNQLVVFGEVDVVVMIETEKNGVAIPHIVREANRKSTRAIQAEIRAVQANPSASPQTTGLAKWGVYAPQWARDVFYWLMLRDPHWFKKQGGTVMVTSVGMFGQGAGWGVGFLPMHTLGVTLGGIAERLALVNGQIVPREYLCVTVSLDHDIVDGAPAARFVQRFRELVESGRCLNE